MFGLSSTEISKIEAVLRKHNVPKAVIFGSRAKGNYKPFSDIDISLEGDISFETLQKIEMELDDLFLPYEIDLIRKNKITDEAVLSHINRVGKTLY